MTTTEHLFSAVLTWSLLAGGAVAFGSDLVSPRQAPAATAAAVSTVHAPAATAVATLPTVTVVGHRAAPATMTAAAARDVVTLPVVSVVGRRAPVQFAAETHGFERRVQ